MAIANVYTSNIPTGEGTALLIIDPQNDFHPGGNLAVPNSDKDAVRISEIILKNVHEISEIYVTLDSHMKYHIAHPTFWVNSETREHPEPGTIVDLKSAEQGLWVAARKEHQRRALEYIRELEKKGKFELIIWPEHCLLGSDGHCVYPVILEALQYWEEVHKKTVTYVMKGLNSLTEHYSALKAEVVLEGEPTTDVNKEFVSKLKTHSSVVICGQALSHCVNFTTRDLADLWDPTSLSRLIVVSDGASAVPSFEQVAKEFLEDMVKKGLTVATAEDVSVFLGNSQEHSAKHEGRLGQNLRWRPQHANESGPKHNAERHISIKQQTNGKSADVVDHEHLDTKASNSDKCNNSEVAVGSWGKGCYLILANDCDGSISLYSQWTDTEFKSSDVTKVLGYFPPGSHLKVPAFRYKNRARELLAKDIRKTADYYHGVAEFVKTAKKGHTNLKWNVSGLDFSVYTFHPADNDTSIHSISKDAPEKVVDLDLSSVSAVVILGNEKTYLQGVKKSSKDLFLRIGLNHGAAVDFHWVAHLN